MGSSCPDARRKLLPRFAAVIGACVLAATATPVVVVTAGDNYLQQSVWSGSGSMPTCYGCGFSADATICAVSVADSPGCTATISGTTTICEPAQVPAMTGTLTLTRGGQTDTFSIVGRSAPVWPLVFAFSGADVGNTAVAEGFVTVTSPIGPPSCGSPLSFSFSGTTTKQKQAASKPCTYAAGMTGPGPAAVNVGGNCTATTSGAGAATLTLGNPQWNCQIANANPFDFTTSAGCSMLGSSVTGDGGIAPSAIAQFAASYASLGQPWSVPFGCHAIFTNPNAADQAQALVAECSLTGVSRPFTH